MNSFLRSWLQLFLQRWHKYLQIFWAIVINDTFAEKQLWLLFGQHLEKLRYVFLASGHADSTKYNILSINNIVLLMR